MEESVAMTWLKDSSRRQLPRPRRPVKIHEGKRALALPHALRHGPLRCTLGALLHWVFTLVEGYRCRGDPDSQALPRGSRFPGISRRVPHPRWPQPAIAHW